MHTFIKIRCEEKNIYNDLKVKEYIEHLFSKEEIVQRRSVVEAKGKALSTCGFDSNWILKSSVLKKIIFWIDSELKKNSKLFCDDDSKRKIVFSKSWTNKMFRGCSGAWHTHPTKENGVVAIFYLNAPKNSSKLIVNENGRIKEVLVETGDLIIHSCDMPHSVSEHKNEQPRICIVFEAQYV